MIIKEKKIETPCQQDLQTIIDAQQKRISDLEKRLEKPEAFLLKK